MILILLLVSSLLQPAYPASSPRLSLQDLYSYDPHSPYGPRHWKGQCQGNQQSPINIHTRTVVYQHFSKPIRYIKYKKDKYFTPGTLENNGHSAVLTVKNNANDDDFGKVLRNVPKFERTDFVFYEFHTHIGGKLRKKDKHRTLPEGSEHVVNGKYYDGEIHLVHWKRDAHTPTQEEAATAPNGLVVLAVFFNVVDRPSGEVDRIISRYVPSVQRIGQKVKAAVNPASILPKDGKFYTYRGSKTTPECLENVIWVVYKTPITISKRSYELLANLETGEEGNVDLRIFGNNRPIQRQDVWNVQANFFPWDDIRKRQGVSAHKKKKQRVISHIKNRKHILTKNTKTQRVSTHQDKRKRVITHTKKKQHAPAHTKKRHHVRSHSKNITPVLTHKRNKQRVLAHIKKKLRVRTREKKNLHVRTHNKKQRVNNKQRILSHKKNKQILSHKNSKQREPTLIENKQRVIPRKKNSQRVVLVKKNRLRLRHRNGPRNSRNRLLHIAPKHKW